MKIHLEIKGARELEEKLKAALSDTTKTAVVADMAAELLDMTEANFRSARYRPVEWAPLAESTRKRKKGKRILVDNGTMIRGFSIQNASASGAEIVNTQPYAVYHQFGTKTMPARPFVPATGEYGSTLEPIPVAKKRMEKTGRVAMWVELQNAGLI